MIADLNKKILFLSYFHSIFASTFFLIVFFSFSYDNEQKKVWIINKGIGEPMKISSN